MKQPISLNGSSPLTIRSTSSRPATASFHGGWQWIVACCQNRKCAAGPITAAVVKTNATRRSVNDQRAQSRVKLKRIVMAASSSLELAPNGRCHEVMAV
jgi:hypothetical protein